MAFSDATLNLIKALRGQVVQNPAFIKVAEIFDRILEEAGGGGDLDTTLEAGDTGKHKSIVLSIGNVDSDDNNMIGKEANIAMGYSNIVGYSNIANVAAWNNETMTITFVNDSLGLNAGDKIFFLRQESADLVALEIVSGGGADYVVKYSQETPLVPMPDTATADPGSVKWQVLHGADETVCSLIQGHSNIVMNDSNQAVGNLNALFSAFNRVAGQNNIVGEPYPGGGGFSDVNGQANWSMLGGNDVKGDNNTVSIGNRVLGSGDQVGMIRRRISNITGDAITVIVGAGNATPKSPEDSPYIVLHLTDGSFYYCRYLSQEDPVDDKVVIHVQTLRTTGDPAAGFPQGDTPSDNPDGNEVWFSDISSFCSDVTGDDNETSGYFNEVNARNAYVEGNYNKLNGIDNKKVGDHGLIQGQRNMANGENEVFGDQNTIGWSQQGHVLSMDLAANSCTLEETDVLSGFGCGNVLLISMGTGTGNLLVRIQTIVDTTTFLYTPLSDSGIDDGPAQLDPTGKSIVKIYSQGAKNSSIVGQNNFNNSANTKVVGTANIVEANATEVVGDSNLSNAGSSIVAGAANRSTGFAEAVFGIQNATMLPTGYNGGGLVSGEGNAISNNSTAIGFKNVAGLKKFAVSGIAVVPGFYTLTHDDTLPDYSLAQGDKIIVTWYPSQVAVGLVQDVPDSTHTKFSLILSNDSIPADFGSVSDMFICLASGNNATAIGKNNQAIKEGSLATGILGVAKNYAEHVHGGGYRAHYNRIILGAHTDDISVNHTLEFGDGNADGIIMGGQANYYVVMHVSLFGATSGGATINFSYNTSFDYSINTISDVVVTAGVGDAADIVASLTINGSDSRKLVIGLKVNGADPIGGEWAAVLHMTGFAAAS